MELIVNQAIKLPGGTEIVLRPDVGKSATAGRELDLNEVVHRILERVEGRPLRGCQVEIETPCSLAVLSGHEAWIHTVRQLSYAPATRCRRLVGGHAVDQRRHYLIEDEGAIDEEVRRLHRGRGRPARTQ